MSCSQTEIQALFSMEYRELGFHVQCVYLTKDTSRMGTVRVKQEEEADTRIIVREFQRNIKERNMGTKGEKSQTRPN